MHRNTRHIQKHQSTNTQRKYTQAIFQKLTGNEYVESSVTASYLEIYNEELADLLIDQGSREVKLQVYWLTGMMHLCLRKVQ